MIETILNHRTIRKYKTTEIEQKVLEQILEAGSRASTTGNMQLYSMVVTTKKRIKDELWGAHFKQDMVKQAPVVITFCADFNRFNKWCRQRNAEPGYDNFLSFYTASVDALLVAQNVALAAESHGLGICYLGTTNYMADAIVDILDLPKDVVPVTTLVMGYPDEEPGLTDRLPMEAVVHYEKYNDFTEEQIDQIYKEKESSDFTKELIEENQTENLAQIFTKKRYTKENNESFSKRLLKVIDEQWYQESDE